MPALFGKVAMVDELVKTSLGSFFTAILVSRDASEDLNDALHKQKHSCSKQSLNYVIYFCLFCIVTWFGLTF